MQYVNKKLKSSYQLELKEFIINLANCNIGALDDGKIWWYNIDLDIIYVVLKYPENSCGI